MAAGNLLPETQPCSALVLATATKVFRASCNAHVRQSRGGQQCSMYVKVEVSQEARMLTSLQIVLIYLSKIRLLDKMLLLEKVSRPGRSSFVRSVSGARRRVGGSVGLPFIYLSSYISVEPLPTHCALIHCCLQDQLHVRLSRVVFCHFTREFALIHPTQRPSLLVALAATHTPSSSRLGGKVGI